MENIEPKNQIIIYEGENGKSHVEVMFEGETAWLTQAQLVDLFQSSKANISEHIKHIFEEKELDRDSVVRNFRTTAAHGNAAAEVIALRANAGKPFMGLLTFSKGGVVKNDIAVAKNYLTEKELKILNNLVSGYFDFAEIQAMKQKPMHMKDYIKQLDNILAATGEKLLSDSGGVSHEQAIDKAELEYKKYQSKTLSEVEKSYLEAIKTVGKKIEKKMRSSNSKPKNCQSC